MGEGYGTASMMQSDGETGGFFSGRGKSGGQWTSVSGRVGEYAKMGCEHARARLEWEREERFRALPERVARRRGSLLDGSSGSAYSGDLEDGGEGCDGLVEGGLAEEEGEKQADRVNKGKGKAEDV
jgi:hypothetical protein